MERVQMNNKFSTRITDYLDDLGKAGFIRYEEASESNRWFVYIPLRDADVEEFILEIFLMDKWVSFTSVIMNNLQGENLPHFYEFLFRFSSYLNGFKFGVTPNGEFITIQTEQNVRDLNRESFIETLKWFNSFYLEWYPVLVNSAKKLNLRFRKGTNSKVDTLMYELIGNDINNIPQISSNFKSRE